MIMFLKLKRKEKREREECHSFSHTIPYTMHADIRDPKEKGKRFSKRPQYDAHVSAIMLQVIIVHQ